MRLALLSIIITLWLTQPLAEGIGYIEEVETPPSPVATYVATVTAYTSSIEECGKDDGITASGLPAEDGMVACDDLPFGTRVVIEGRHYVVADRFGGGYQRRFDIWMPSRADAYRFGRKQVEVQVIEMGDGENVR
ncbi:3D domain-containing protein [Anaeroselena agilis]|uniref:3D domain-containing protein n=1 Tax=Anaeroselena agilis TaxID=3063788 RepID=A0ABU3NVW5_9FIRM|nr:3D domain-containing protein [Selenomonadales bacterium 4137-cl]